MRLDDLIGCCRYYYITKGVNKYRCVSCGKTFNEKGESQEDKKGAVELPATPQSQNKRDSGELSLIHI